PRFSTAHSLGEIEAGRRRWTPQADGRDHPLRRHDEHRLMLHIAEDVDVVGAVDLGGGEGRRRLRLRRGGERDTNQRGHAGDMSSRHRILPHCVHKRAAGCEVYRYVVTLRAETPGWRSMTDQAP